MSVSTRLTQSTCQRTTGAQGIDHAPWHGGALFAPEIKVHLMGCWTRRQENDAGIKKSC
jgi:hypothetical protein